MYFYLWQFLLSQLLLSPFLNAIITSATSTRSPYSHFLPFTLSPREENCGYAKANIVNSTGTNTTLNPFILPSGPFNTTDRNWTWTLTTSTTGPNEEAIDFIQQKLFLDINPSIDLVSTDLGGIGCGVIFHGLNHAALFRGQEDSGNCRSMLSSYCIEALQNQVDIFGEKCTWNGTNVLPHECVYYFNKEVTIQTFVFASTNASDLCATDEGDKDNQKQQPERLPIAAWGFDAFVHNSTEPSYQGYSLTPYDSLTTLVSPIMVHLGNNPEGRLFCARSNIIANGSLIPGGVPGENDEPWWALLVEIVALSILLGIALI